MPFGIERRGQYGPDRRQGYDAMGSVIHRPEDPLRAAAIRSATPATPSPSGTWAATRQTPGGTRPMTPVSASGGGLLGRTMTRLQGTGAGSPMAITQAVAGNPASQAGQAIAAGATPASGQQVAGQSTATQIPQYQPVGMVRERSDSMDPGSFMRRQAYETAMANQNAAFGQQARAQQANVQQQAAAAGVQGPAALALQNQAMGQIRDAQSGAMGQLAAGYYGGEADAASQMGAREWQAGQAQLDRDAAIRAQQTGLIGQFATTEAMGDKGWRALQAQQALQAGDPNWYRYFDPNWGRDGAGGGSDALTGAATAAAGTTLESGPAISGYEGQVYSYGGKFWKHTGGKWVPLS